jgi:hypothetical protein
MSIRVHWTPSGPPTASYAVSGAPEASGTFLSLGTVSAALDANPNWDAASSRFFWDDASGTPQSVYRVRAVGPRGEVVADSGVFQPAVVRGGGTENRRRLDHHHGAQDALRYATGNGVGVPDAEIRVFRAADWDAGRREVAVGVTVTDPDGRWISPLYVEPLSYVVVFFKAGFYGPNLARVTVTL